MYSLFYERVRWEHRSTAFLSFGNVFSCKLVQPVDVMCVLKLDHLQLCRCLIRCCCCHSCASLEEVCVREGGEWWGWMSEDTTIPRLYRGVQAGWTSSVSRFLCSSCLICTRLSTFCCWLLVKMSVPPQVVLSLWFFDEFKVKIFFSHKRTLRFS